MLSDYIYKKSHLSADDALRRLMLEPKKQISMFVCVFSQSILIGQSNHLSINLQRHDSTTLRHTVSQLHA